MSHDPRNVNWINVLDVDTAADMCLKRTTVSKKQKKKILTQNKTCYTEATLAEERIRKKILEREMPANDQEI